MDHSTHIQSSPGSGWSRGKIVLIAFLAIAGFYLLAEHRAHAFAVLPFLLLPACLLMRAARRVPVWTSARLIGMRSPRDRGFS